MKEIPLTQGQVALVDDDTYAELVKRKWYASYDPDTNGYRAYTTIKGRNVLMSRFILGVHGGQLVDHIDHNALNNQVGNLRLATRAQNAMNQRKRPTATSPYKGITWSKAVRKWQAQIMHNYKHIFLGYHTDAKEAALAYDRKARELFGEFACCNFEATA